MSGDPLQVLLVEDDEFYAHVLRGALSRAAPHVALARCATVAEAEERLASDRPDAVLLDLNLPDEAGLATVRRIRAVAPELPIVVLTADGDSDVALAAVQEGAQDYLIKSETDGRILSRALRYAIDRAHIQAELVRRERHFRALIESAYDIVVVLGQDGTFRYQSPAVSRVLGYEPEELDGANVLDVMHPDDRERARAILSSNPLPLQGDDEQFHFRLKHKDGTYRVLEALGSWLEKEPGNGIVVNARDVTERLRAEEQLRLTEAKLRQAHKMEAVGRLAGGIAHDFNNVLTAIYGYADLLIEEFEPEDPRRRDVEEIRRSAERAASLTRQLLAFSRQSMVQPRVLDLNTVVENALRILGRMIGPEVRLVFEPAPGLWPVRADQGQIEQVLMNLASNARDAMPDGGTLTIAAANQSVSPDAASGLPGLAPGDYVTVTITDTGVGMTDDVRRQVFEPFFTTKPQGEGTGLGLATVYGIVKQSGGGVYVESAPGRGTTFTIYLPPHRPTSAP